MKNVATSSDRPEEQSKTSLSTSADSIGIYYLPHNSTRAITRREFLTLTLISATSALVACSAPKLTTTATTAPPTNPPPTRTPVPNTSSELITYDVPIPEWHSGGLQMRRNPRFDSEEIAFLPSGMFVTLIGQNSNGQWAEVQLSNGVTGWIVAGPFKEDARVDFSKLVISSRAATVPASALSPGGNENELVEDVANEVLETLAEEAIEAAGDVVRESLPPRPTRVPSPATGGSDSLVLPCAPGAVPPGYICTCNCI